MAGRDRTDARRAAVPVWLWLGAVCALLVTLWVVQTRREKPLVPTVATTGKIGEHESEIVAEDGVSAGTVRRWSRTIGTLVVLTLAIFIYSAAR